MVPLIALSHTAAFELLVLQATTIRSLVLPLDWPYIKNILKFESIGFNDPTNTFVLNPNKPDEKEKSYRTIWWSSAANMKKQQLSTIMKGPKFDFVIDKLLSWKGAVVTAKDLGAIHSTTIIAERLGDLRRKAFGIASALRTLKKLKPNILKNILICLTPLKVILD